MRLPATYHGLAFAHARTGTPSMVWTRSSSPGDLGFDIKRLASRSRSSIAWGLMQTTAGFSPAGLQLSHRRIARQISSIMWAFAAASDACWCQCCCHSIHTLGRRGWDVFGFRLQHEAQHRHTRCRTLNPDSLRSCWERQGCGLKRLQKVASYRSKGSLTDVEIATSTP